MTTFLKFSLILLSSVFLFGCRQSYTHEYLLQHPHKIQTELANCRADTEYSSYCDMVKHTSDEFAALVEVRSENPQEFGKQILLVQTTLAAAKKAKQAAATEYKALKAKNPMDLGLSAAQQKLTTAKQNYRVQLQKLQTLFSVVSATMSPGAQ